MPTVDLYYNSAHSTSGTQYSMQNTATVNLGESNSVGLLLQGAWWKMNIDNLDASEVGDINSAQIQFGAYGNAAGVVVYTTNLYQSDGTTGFTGMGQGNTMTFTTSDTSDFQDISMTAIATSDGSTAWTHSDINNSIIQLWYVAATSGAPIMAVDYVRLRVDYDTAVTYQPLNTNLNILGGSLTMNGGTLNIT